MTILATSSLCPHQVIPGSELKRATLQCAYAADQQGILEDRERNGDLNVQNCSMNLGFRFRLMFGCGMLLFADW